MRLDPDNQELYLDNEIALLDRLKAMKKMTLAKTRSVQPASVVVLAKSDVYFAHRFFKVPAEELAAEPVQLAACEANGLKKVAQGVETEAVEISSLDPFGWDDESGEHQYFQMMENNLERLSVCGLVSPEAI